jgi:hypothetical protein
VLDNGGGRGVRTIDLSDRSRRIDIPEDFSILDEMELLDLRTAFKAREDEVGRQIYEYNSGSLPEHMMTEEWLSRALKARAFYKQLRKRAGVEMARRQAQKKQANAERKVANISRDAMSDDMKAFIEAAKQVLSQEVYMSIWKMAREAHPEAFADVREDAA